MFKQTAVGACCIQSCFLVFILAGVKSVVWCVNLMCLYHTSGHNMAVTDWLIYLYLYGALIMYVGFFSWLCTKTRLSMWHPREVEDDGNPYKTFCSDYPL